MELFEQYRQLLIKINPLIKNRILLQSSSKINIENLDSYNSIGSKQAYSRIAPLKILHKNIKIINQPNILDTFFINKIIRSEKLENDDCFVINQEDMSKCWSIMNLVPLLVYKHKKVIMKGRPSGCNIGARPIDLYVMLMESLGIYVQKINNSYYFEYRGIFEDIFIELPFPSFSGTSIACYLALVRDYETCITNVSIEPEIIFLINTIRRMGYKIWFEKETRTIRIIGNSNLKVENMQINIPEDRNILVTRMISRIISKQKMQFIANYGLDFEVLYNFFKEIGIDCHINNNYIVINGDKDRYNQAVEVDYGFYPKLCTDWQPIISILLLNCCKEFKIKDEVFECRYEYIEQLASFLNGFEFQYDDKQLYVKKIEPISIKSQNQNRFECLDIRASATLYLALNNWKVPNFEIGNLDQFFRGYSSISDFSRDFEMRCKYVFDVE